MVLGLAVSGCRSVKTSQYRLTPETRLLPPMLTVGKGDYFREFLRGGIFEDGDGEPMGFLVSEESVATTLRERKGRLFLSGVMMGLPSLLGMPVGESSSSASVSLKVYDSRGSELAQLRSTGEGQATVACWYGYSTTGSRRVASSEALAEASRDLLARLRERFGEVDGRLRDAGPLTPASFNLLAKDRPEVARRIVLSQDQREALTTGMDATALQGRAAEAAPAQEIWGVAGETWMSESTRAAEERGAQSKSLITSENERRIASVESMRAGDGSVRAFQAEWNASDPSVGLLGVVAWLHDPRRSTYVLGLHTDSERATAGRSASPVQDVYAMQLTSATAGLISVRREGLINAETLPLPEGLDLYAESTHLSLGARTVELAQDSETSVFFEIRFVDGRLREVVRLDP